MRNRNESDKDKYARLRRNKNSSIESQLRRQQLGQVRRYPGMGVFRDSSRLD